MDDLKDAKPLSPLERMYEEERQSREWVFDQRQRKVRAKAEAKAQKVAQLTRIEAKLDEVLVLLRAS